MKRISLLLGVLVLVLVAAQLSPERASAAYPPAGSRLLCTAEDTSAETEESIDILCVVLDSNGDPVPDVDITISIAFQTTCGATIDGGSSVMLITDANGSVEADLFTGFCEGFIVISAQAGTLLSQLIVLVEEDEDTDSGSPDAPPDTSTPGTTSPGSGTPATNVGVASRVVCTPASADVAVGSNTTIRCIVTDLLGNPVGGLTIVISIGYEPGTDAELGSKSVTRVSNAQGVVEANLFVGTRGGFIIVQANGAGLFGQLVVTVRGPSGVQQAPPTQPAPATQAPSIIPPNTGDAGLYSIGLAPSRAALPVSMILVAAATGITLLRVGRRISR